MSIKFANSAFATLAAGINSSATSITLTTGQGARFPSLGAGDYFYATLIDASNNLEIVKCTARSTDVLTVTRAQESTTARAFSTGDRIELRITAAGMNEAVGILDGDRGDITVSGDGLVWTIDSLAVTDAKINSMAATKLTGTIDRARMFAGSVLQVQHVQKTDAFTSSTQAWTDVTGLSLSITPYFSTSKILVISHVCMGGENPWGGSHWRQLRGATVLSVTSVTGHQVQAHTGGLMYNSGHGVYDRVLIDFDSPATTSSTTYKLQAYPENDGGSGTIYVNTCGSPSTSYSSGGVSSMLLLEIAQ